MHDMTVVLSSGGMDSTVALYNILRATDDYILPLWFFSGTKYQNREYEAAMHIYKHLRCNHSARVGVMHQVRMDVDFTDLPEPPEGLFTPDSLRKVVIPQRNLVYCAMAAQYAEEKGASRVVIGIHTAPGPVIPDSTPDWLKKVNEVIRLGGYGDVTIEAPLLYMTKPMIVWVGSQLGAPLHLTYSCHNGYNSPCGRCVACSHRKEAFIAAGVKDPTDYKEK